MRPETLTDGSVWLDVPTAADIDVVTKLCQEPSIGEWTSMPVPYQRSDAVEFIGEMIPSGWALRSPTWAVRTRPDGDLVGMIGLTDNGDLSAEIGFWLGSAFRARGLMTAAVALVCDYAFRPDEPGPAGPVAMGLVRLEWRAFVGNHASAAVIRRAGFQFEGTIRAGAMQRGTLRDCWIAGLLHDDPPGPVGDWPEGI
ncbi:GNAT family N-acetyltransferase [Aldersonia kunmingensis]|uniref:GNAT family N-acetyltransferase n=1 Tax=Aldersonia kunmingensis TaxID=408066 RepID=UPI000832C80E|nr:GNAT family N-acetyltransferase [Aldersonia kunmingensis]